MDECTVPVQFHSLADSFPRPNRIMSIKAVHNQLRSVFFLITNHFDIRYGNQSFAQHRIEMRD